MNDILASQLAIDYCCTVPDVTDGENHFSVFVPKDGRRRFDYTDDCPLAVAVVNGKFLVTGQEQLVGCVKPILLGTDAAWGFDGATLSQLDHAIEPFGWRIHRVHPFFLPAKNVPARTDGWEIRRYEAKEIEVFRGDGRFPEAFSFRASAPDVLGFAALRDGQIAGMAGASADSPTMWQIGINVCPGFEGLGVGAMLVTLLKDEILSRGALPFYGTAMSHIASQRVALKAGFLPAWAELVVEKR